MVKKGKYILVLLFFAFSFHLSSFSFGEIFYVSEDAFTDALFPKTTSPYNHPNGKYLWSGVLVNTSNQVYTKAYTFLKFELPQNWIWQNSSLHIYCNYAKGDGGGVLTTKVWYLADDTWSDDTITYNNMPDFSSSPVLDSKYINSEGWVIFDVSGLFGLETDDTVSLVLGTILPSESTSYYYWRDFENKEYKGSNNKAYLYAYNPIPEPATLLLLGSGLLGLGGLSFRKRKQKA